MKYLIVIFSLMLSVEGITQQMDIIIDEEGAGRTGFFLNNVNNSIRNAVSLKIQSGSLPDPSIGSFSAWGENYALIAGYGGYSGVSGLSKGLLLRAPNPTGNIMFVTGGESLIDNARLFVRDNGNVGVGTTDPRTKLHVAGDIFMSTAGQKIILKVNTNTCRALEISASGAVTAPVVPCP